MVEHVANVSGSLRKKENHQGEVNMQTDLSYCDEDFMIEEGLEKERKKKEREITVVVV